MDKAIIDAVRVDNGFLTVDETLALNTTGNVIFDPFSTLISRYAEIGSANVFYPGSIVNCSQNASCVIGDGNIFHPMTTIAATEGSIVLGNRNVFGDGGFSARADRYGAEIIIGDRGRYSSGAGVFGKSSLGTGSQIIGQISAVSCSLAAGEDFNHPDPDLRAGVLKGYGSAKEINVGVGEVILGRGGFQQNDIQRQTDFHPKRQSPE